jgi:hypothetical protein
LAGIADQSTTVLNQMRKAVAASAASGGGGGGGGGGYGTGSRDMHDNFPGMDNLYGGDNGPSIKTIMEVCSFIGM